MKKKWKSLCDTYRTYKNKQQKPSGSAGTSQKKWVHFERMKFLNDMQLETETVTNIATFPSEESNDTMTFDEHSSSDRGSRKHKRSCSSIDSEDGSNFDRLIDAINQPINIPPFVPPKPPPSDKATLYGNLVTAQLREINPEVMDDIMLQVMQLLNNAKKNNSY
ncbi:PREDICTED: uncharacterized protein LOC105555868 [Vollenhovia emeryi]|uniref:uncharacterized protein LOC105555868 n=1 Tax=Vollenhovia emeryi TaxID=411798 RepID=UPI0005F47BD2|nr:PREDICTED: uncharacterized protein LOC105555868 [Vollenhovia emeryi]